MRVTPWVQPVGHAPPPSRKSGARTVGLRDIRAEADEDKDKVLFSFRPSAFWTCCCMHRRRFFLRAVNELELLPWEKRIVLEQSEDPQTHCCLLVRPLGLELRAAQYCLWRRTLLFVGTFFFALVLLLDIGQLLDQLSTDRSGKPLVAGLFFPEKYWHHFDVLTLYTTLHTVGTLLGATAAVALAALSAFWWPRFSASKKSARVSFAFTFLTPFLLLLCIPIRDGVDIMGIEQDFCQEVLNIAAQANSTMTGPQRASLAMLATTVPFADAILSHHEILPPGLCSLRPTDWGAQIVQALRAAGLEFQDDGRCPASDTQLEKMLQSSSLAAAAAGANQSMQAYVKAIAGDCPAECSVCTSVLCQQSILQLSALLTVYSRDALESDAPAGLSQAARNCGHCPACLTNRSCAFLAEDITRVALSFAPADRMSAPNSGGSQQGCLSPQVLESLELYSRLVLEPGLWRMLIGLLNALISQLQLIPMAISMMLGVGAGEVIAKSSLPTSRIPDVVGTYSALFICPYLLQVAVIVQGSIGGLFCLIVVLFVLLAILMPYVPFIGFQSRSRKELHRMKKIVERLATFFKVCAFAAMVAGAFQSEALQSVATAARLLVMRVEAEAAVSYTETLVFKCVRMVFSFLGQSVISLVVFVDLAVETSCRVHHLDTGDLVTIQESRIHNVQDLLTFVAPNGDDSKQGDLTPCKEEAALSKTILRYR
ncbi:unnamed protein product, partial [Polarella glacialis]